MKHIKLFEDFLNENLNESKFKTFRMKIKTDKELAHMTKPALKKLKDKLEDKRGDIEAKYNKELVTYSRPGIESDFQYDRTLISTYIKTINQLI